jgi:hypothetical protein
LKRLIVYVAATAALAAAAAAPATAGPAKTSPTAQIKALQKQVTTLQKQVRLLTNALEANFAYDECQTAITADTFQWTWALTDKLTTFPLFPPTSTSPQVDDKQSCSAINVTRATVDDQSAPTQAIFQTLINWIG